MEKFEVEYSLADAQDTINDFLNGTPGWYEEILGENKHRPCSLCGISPDKMKKLAKAIELYYQKNKN